MAVLRDDPSLLNTLKSLSLNDIITTTTFLERLISIHFVIPIHFFIYHHLEFAPTSWQKKTTTFLTAKSKGLFLILICFLYSIWYCWSNDGPTCPIPGLLSGCLVLCPSVKPQCGRVFCHWPFSLPFLPLSSCPFHALWLLLTFILHNPLRGIPCQLLYWWLTDWVST